MLAAYERRCAYLATAFDHATGSPTVDHALPKSYAWDQVYEWSNYRLCAAIINSMKGELLNLVDPFEVKQRWFELELTYWHIQRGTGAPQSHWTKIDATLPLLNRSDCCRQREAFVTEYQSGHIDLDYLERHAPFIALELRRQGRLLQRDR